MNSPGGARHPIVASTALIRAVLSIDSLEGRDSGELLLVERLADDLSIADVHLAIVDIGDRRQGVLHPLLVVSLGEVVAGVGSSGLLPIFGGHDGLGCLDYS